MAEKTNEVVIEPTSGIAVKVKLEGLFTFIKNRVGWTHEQLGFWEFDCEKPIFRPKNYELQLSPNPVFENLTIKWTDENAMGFSQIAVFNALGQLV